MAESLAALWSSRVQAVGPVARSPESPSADRLVVRKRWRDPRLAAGLALVACSIVVGTLVVSGADDRVMVLSAANDLGAGTRIQPGDLRVVAVRLDAVGQYLGVSETELVGRTLARAVGAGELVPQSAIGSSGGPSRLVTLPVEPMHGPAGLGHGDRVDVYVSERDSTRSTASRLVLSNALVAEAGTGSDSATGETAVVLDVDPIAAPAVVAAGRSGVIDLVRVPVTAP